MFPRKDFALRVSTLRISKNLSQEALGEQFGVTKATISRIESADRAVSVDLLIALADFFDVSLDYLVGRSDNPSRR